MSVEIEVTHPDSGTVGMANLFHLGRILEGSLKQFKGLDVEIDASIDDVDQRYIAVDILIDRGCGAVVSRSLILR